MTLISVISGCFLTIWVTWRTFSLYFIHVHTLHRPGQLSRYSDSLRAGRSGDRIPVGARFSALAQTGPGAYPASSTMGTGSFPGVNGPGRGADHPLSPKRRGHERVELYLPLLTIWAFVACQRENFTLLFTYPSSSSSSSLALQLITSLGLQKFPPIFSIHSCCPPASYSRYPFFLYHFITPPGTQSFSLP